MKNKLKSILSIEIPFLYLKKTLALVLIAGMVLTNGDFALLGHTVVEAAASSFKANGTSVDLDTPESWQAMANAKNNITDKSGVSQSVLGKAWLYGVVANEWNFDGESETNFAVKTLSGKAGQTGVTDKAKGDLSAESMVGESTTNGVVQIKGVPETLTLPKGQESKFFDSCNGLIYKYDTKENIEAAIDAMRSHVAQQSADMAQKNSIPDYSKVARGDSAQKITLDFTESPEGTIYVNVDQWVVNSQWEVNDWSLSQAFKENGAITIKKKSNQIIVFNFSGSEVNLNKMIIEEGGKSQDTVGIANTPSSSNDIIEGLYFNMPNATKVHLQDSAGIFIAPKATVTTGGVGGGWLICDKLINGCEWHFTNGKLPDTYGKDSVQFHAVKNIAGQPADKDGFTFTLSEKDGNKWNTIQTKTNKGSAIDFDSIEYKYDTKNPNQEVKLYRISEEDKQTLNGVTYNAEKTDYYARVTLDKTSAAGQGNSNNYSVKASVAYYKDEACSQLIDTETPVFNNTEANGSLTVLKSVSGPEGFKLTDDQKQAIVFTVSDSNGATIASFTYKNMLDHSGVTLPDGSVVQVTYEKGGVKLSNLTPGSYTVSENVDQAKDVAGYAHTTTVTVDGKEETKNSGTVKVESAKDASIAFKNSYAQASVELKGTKTIDGNKPKDKEFAFSLYKASKNGKDFKRGDFIQTVRNNGEGNFSFSTITYSKEGTYYYFILEEDPSRDAEEQETGIKKNTQKYLVTVVVQKNNDGSLTAEAPSYQEMASANGKSTKPSNTAAFMNTTEKSLGSISLSAKKELIGRDLKAGEFTFELVAADQDGKPITENGKEVILQSVKNGVKKADGSNNIQFKEITYQKDLYSGIDQRGTYYYIVREKQGTDSHIAYTKVTYLVTVNVTDSKTDGKLKVEKSIQLLSDGTSNETAKATNTNKENIEFVNTYSASGSITISGKKTVNGKSITINDQAQSISGAKNQVFTFCLDQMTKDGVEASEKSDGLHRTAKTNASGRFTFDKIPYTLDDAGNTYYYKLSEDTSKLQAGYSKDFDDQYISVKVEKSVKDDGTDKDDGTLKLTISSKTYDKDGKVKKSDVATINVNGADYTYDAGNLNNKYDASTSVKLHGNKTINGQKPSKDVTDKFSFKLSLLEWTDANGSVHTQKDDTYRQTVKTDNYSQTVKTDKDGNFSFKPLDFNLDDEHNQIGTYKYQIEEVDVPEGYSVNTSAQIVIVKIEDNGKGQLVATMTDENNRAIKADPEKNSYTVKGYTFDNTYEAAGSITISGKKTVNGKAIDDQEQSISGAKNQEFIFSLDQMDGDGAKASEKRDGLHRTAKSDASGRFTFGKIPYTLDDAGKTYYYKLSEDTSNLPAGYSKDFDDQYISVKVEESDKDDGTLKLTINSKTYDKDGKVKKSNGATIHATNADYTYDAGNLNNKYAASTSVKLHGNKTINGQKPSKDIKDKFSFKLSLLEWTDANGSVHTQKDDTYSQTVKTDKDGSFSFKPLEFNLDASHNQIGTYKYKIEEVDVPEGYSVNTSAQIVIVKIEDNGKGQLVATMPDENDKAIKADPEKNSYIVKGYTFDNTYQASGELNLSGTKTLIGKDLKQGDFKFILRQTDKDGKELTDGYSETVSNAAPSTDMGANANGSTAGFAFRAIGYTEADAGKDFYYTVSELAGDQAGITYDRNVYQIHVKVTDNGDGTLKVERKDDVNQISFTNFYNASASLKLNLIKTINGKTVDESHVAKLEDKEFTFTLTEMDGKGEKASPKKNGKTETITVSGKDGKASFSTLNYTLADKNQTYYYRIAEDASTSKMPKGFAKDGKDFYFSITVSDDGSGLLHLTSDSDALNDGMNGNTFTAEYALGHTFNNTYSASGELPVKGNKTINGLSPDKDVKDLFAFTLTEISVNDVPVEKPYTETVKTDKDGKFSFSSLKYSMNPDIANSPSGSVKYIYKIEETSCPTGYTKDTDPKNLEVIVSDNGDGTLSIQSTEPEAGYTFNNLYNAKGSITLRGKKTLHGRDMEADEFHFTVTETDDKGTALKVKNAEGKEADKVVARGSNAAASAEQDADITFSSISYSDKSQVGKHYYTITEDPVDTDKGLSQNTEAYKVVVDVSDNGDGTLTAEAVSGTDKNGDAIDPATGIAFTNTYKASGTITLNGSKKLIGRDMEADEFHFTVTETDDKGNPLKVKDSDGNTVDKVVARGSNAAASKDQAAAITFDPITYDSVDAVGTHTYEITEDPFQGAAEDGSKDGLQANCQKYIVQVEVSDNGYGTLKAEVVSGTDQDGQTIAPDSGVVFTNTYKASGAITLNGSKKLTGRDMEADEFHFTVTETDDKGNPLKVKDADGNTADKVVARGSNAAASKDQAAAITFDPITYDSVDAVGTHTYEITEDPFQGAAEDGSKDGLQANTQRYIVQVEVSDNRDGTLTAEAVSATDQNGQTITPASGIVFTNNYKAYGSLDLLGIKILEGRQLTTQDNFRFVVEEETRDAEGNVNRRQVSSAKLTQESIAADKQSAKLVFDRINYTLADVGTHTYKIHEVIPEAAEKIAGITYDTREYTLVVTVSDKGDGTLTVETRDAAGNKVDVTKADTYSFKNSYAANGDITLTGSKTLVGRDMKDGEFSFTVREQNEDGSYKKAADGTDLIVATGKNQAAKNGQPAAITFDPITYDSVDAVGTHTYEITEDPFQDAAEDGSKDGLQANTQSYIVQVEVSDNGDGTLKAEVISGTDADGEAINPATDIAFINTYEASGDHSFYGTKTVAGRDLTPGEDYQFQVEEVITDEDGKENRVEVSTGHLNPETIVGNHGDILFGTLHYTLADVGTHTYKIHEVIPADQDKMAGISYDKTEYTEIVTVSDKGDGSLEVVAKDADGNLINSGETKTYNFTNTYQNVAVRFTGSKTLAGGDIASYPGAFRFDLVDSDGQVIDTAKNDATGRFTFAPIYYEASDVGEHTYTIVEENAGRIINGIKYDDSEIPVTVTVENRAGKLVATGQVEGDEIAFHNEKLSEITVQKNWADDQNAANARPQQITVDLLQNEQVVRSAVLTGATDTWTYTFKDLTPGTYKVRERSDSPYYEVSYDKQILDLTDENGQAKDETVTITNTFERTVDLVAYKDLMGQALNDGQFRFVLHRNSDGDDTSHDLTTTNRGDGSISFYDVTYDPNGYTMYEVAEQSKYPHITFDEHNSIATGLRFDPEGNPITQEDGTALYTFKNVYRPIVLRVQKRSKSAPFDPLVGATYGLYRYSADGNDVLVEAQLSDSNGYMYYGKIEPGVIYYFKEISAPAGHEVDPYAGKHFQVKYTENGNIAVYDEDGNPDTTYGDITTMEDKTEGYRTTEIIKEKDSLDEIQANEKQSRYAFTGNGVDAVAIADKGAFPEGTTMVVTPLTGDRLAEVETLLENNVGQFNTMAFYDITFTDADGKEVEPAFGDVNVTIQPEVGLDTKGIELKNLKLIHLIDDGDPESTVKTVSLVTGSIAAEEKDGEEKLTQTKITSKSFSVFGLIDPKDSTLGNNYLLTANGVGDFVSKLKVAKLDTQGNFIPNATLDVYTFDPKKKDGIGERVIRWTTAEGCQYLQRILNVETPYVLVETNAPDGYAIADNIIFSIGKYDSSITCYTLKDGKLAASEKETQLHTNGSELIMVDDPITVMNKTDYKIIPQVKELTRDREITVPGAPKTGDQPIIPLVVILLAGIIGFAGIEIEKRRKNREEKQK